MTAVVPHTGLEKSELRVAMLGARTGLLARPRALGKLRQDVNAKHRALRRTPLTVGSP